MKPISQKYFPQMANRQVCAMAIEENGNTTLHYVYTDHLGSINAVTNAADVLEAKLDFDAWGRRRNPVDYSYLPNNTAQIDNGLNTSSTLPAWLYRGYTGHEMLDEFTLINMNARLYDPVLGLMAGVDNVIQAPNYTQNYSRYSYCDNNPLKYTDPDGNRFTVAHLALAGIGGQAAWGPLMQHAQGKINGWQAAGLYGVNVAAFVASAGVSSVGTGLGNLFLSGAVSGAISSGGSAAIYGQTGDQIVSNSLKGALAGGLGSVTNWGCGAGGFGSLMGSATNSAIYGLLNKNEPIDILKNAAIAGSISLSSYYLSASLDFTFNKIEDWGGQRISFRQHLKMQRAFQLSKVSKKEFGGFLWAKKASLVSGTDYGIRLGQAPEGFTSDYHTHWDIEGKDITTLADGTIADGLNYPIGTSTLGYKCKTQLNHSDIDLSHTAGKPSFVINRFHVSYHPGYGGLENIQLCHPNLQRNILNYQFILQ